MRQYWCIICKARQFKQSAPMHCPACKSIWIIPSEFVKEALKLKLPKSV
jgi:predicted Zn-ribbon and HTH transcriptional regulator